MNTFKHIAGFIMHNVRLAGELANILLAGLYENPPTKHAVVLVTNDKRSTPHNVKINSPHKF